MANMKIVFTELVNALKSKDSNKVLTTAEFIYDETLQNYQAILNVSFDSKIKYLETLIAYLEARLKKLESAKLITSIAMSDPQMLFTSYIPQTITAIVTPEDATEIIVWETSSGEVILTPNEDGRLCVVYPAIDAKDGTYTLTAKSPSNDAIKAEIPVIFDGVENVVVTPTVTLDGITEAEIGSEMVITASFKDMLTDYYKWYVNSGATIVSQSRETCTIRINDDSTLAGKTISVDYEYDIVADGSDSASVSHSILVKAKEEPDEPIVPTGEWDMGGATTEGEAIDLGNAATEGEVLDFGNANLE